MTTWIVLRAAGIGAYLMLFMSVAWGLVSTTALFGKRWSKVSTNQIHQFMSTAGLLLLAVHLGGLMLDSFAPFKLLDLLLPFRNAYRPVAVTFGIVAMYGTVLILGTSWIRKKLSTKFWRVIHLLAVPMFTAAMVHGIFAGTDTARPWMFWTYVGTGALTVFLVLVRGLTAGFRPERAPRPERAGPAPLPIEPAEPERAAEPVAV